MKGLKRLALIGAICVTAIIGFTRVAMGEPTLSGANYWGDSNNAIIDSSDMGQLK